VWSCVWQFRTKSQSNPCDPGTLSDIDKFNVGDANGGNQTLYVYNASRGLALGKQDFDLPPAPPQGIFNARFNSDKFIESVPAGRGLKNIAINVQDAALPITLNWNIKPENGTRYWLIMRGGRVEITGSSSFSFYELDNGQIRLQAESQPCEQLKTVFNYQEDVKAKPKTYVLSQNIPNPFNPSTIIQYELPEESQVTLQVYNTLGQEVASLVNEVQVAGNKTVVFDASNFPSGVYFYKLSAGSFTQIKKMLLIK